MGEGYVRGVPIRERKRTHSIGILVERCGGALGIEGEYSQILGLCTVYVKLFLASIDQVMATRTTTWCLGNQRFE